MRSRRRPNWKLIVFIITLPISLPLFIAFVFLGTLVMLIVKFAMCMFDLCFPIVHEFEWRDGDSKGDVDDGCARKRREEE